MTKMSELEKLKLYYRHTLLNRLNNMFIFKNMPKEIDLTYFNMSLFTKGKICVLKHNGDLLANVCNNAETPNEYYRHNRVLCVNPYTTQPLSKIITDEKDGVIFYNCDIDIYGDDTSIISELIDRTAEQLAENDISIRCTQENTRVNAIIVSSDEQQKKAGELYSQQVKDGNTIIYMASDLVNSINVNPLATASTNSNATELLQLRQYIIADFYQAIGLKSNNIMKKERLISAEIEVNDNVLLINVNNMLEQRKIGVEKLNKLYGLNVSVTLNENWQEIPPTQETETDETETDETGVIIDE